MNMEIHDGSDPLPDEEDIYGVNDIEERERFNALLGCGSSTQEERFRRRRLLVAAVAVLILVAGLGYFLASQAAFGH